MPSRPTQPCPRCRQLDMIQKLSAVYSQGITTGSYSGPTGGLAAPIGSGRPALVTGYTVVHGSAQSELSRKLAPPSKPPFRIPPSPQVIPPFIVGTIASAALISIGLSSELIAIQVAVTAVGVALFLIVGIWSRRQLEKHDRIAKNRYQTDILPLWESQMEIWNRLYYCSRDDCVFDPLSGESAIIDQMPSLWAAKAPGITARRDG